MDIDRSGNCLLRKLNILLFSLELSLRCDIGIVS